MFLCSLNVRTNDSQIYIQRIIKPRLVSKLISFQTCFEFVSRNFKMREHGHHDDRHHRDDDDEQV
jgi:hypothetical protein